MVMQALRRNPSRDQVVVGRSIPAPVGGWDAQNPLAAMPAENAPILDNFIPRAGYVEMRKGYAEWSPTESPVETVIVWRGSTTGADQIHSAAGSEIIDTTNPYGSTVLYSGAGNARWQYVNFSNDAGRFVFAVNGANIPVTYDGTAYVNRTITGSVGPIVLDPTTISDVMAHKRRIFLLEEGSMRVWFLDVNAIQGTAQLLDLGPVFQKGGRLSCMATWSLDAGDGPDDYAVFVTTEGEVAVYAGEDPSDATNWSLIGVFALGNPLGKRALFKYGADLAILTVDGVFPLSQALSLDRAQSNLVAVTQKIMNAFSLATTRYGSNFGWSGMLYARGTLAIFNVPTSQGVLADQYVQNVQTGAWARFTGIPAICWAIANDRPYFGSSTGIYEWDVGASDNGAEIVGDLKTAFNYFGQRGKLKQFTMLRPLIRADQDVRPALEMLVDYKEAIPTAIPTVIAVPEAMWDEAIWDESFWPTEEEIRNDWTSVTGIGYCGSVRMRVSTGVGAGVYLAVDDEDLVAWDADADDLILIQPLSTSTVSIQVIAFDVMFQPGGQL